LKKIFYTIDPYFCIFPMMDTLQFKIHLLNWLALGWGSFRCFLLLFNNPIIDEKNFNTKGRSYIEYQLYESRDVPTRVPKIVNLFFMSECS